MKPNTKPVLDINSATRQWTQRLKQENNALELTAKTRQTRYKKSEFKSKKQTQELYTKPELDYSRVQNKTNSSTRIKETKSKTTKL